MNAGRKIPRVLENPFDNVLIDIGEWMNPTWARFSLTPNHLTAISFATGMLAALLAWKKRFYAAAGVMLVSYAFDCFDGNYARATGQVTRFGDMFDHVSDVIKYSAITLLITGEIRGSNRRYAFLGVAFLLCMATMVHLGCQELVYYSAGGQQALMLNQTTRACPGGAKWIKYTKYLGCGTFTLYFIAVLVALGAVRS